MNTITARAPTGVAGAAATPVLAAHGVERAYRRGLWPARPLPPGAARGRPDPGHG
jgi:hypothetical protein